MNHIGDPDEEMEPRNASQRTEVSPVAVRLPPFWPERPVLWFAQADSQFTLTGIIDERPKFHHTTSQLEQRYAAEVEDIIISPPHHKPYTKLRTDTKTAGTLETATLASAPHTRGHGRPQALSIPAAP
jgi:hypothetical protein